MTEFNLSQRNAIQHQNGPCMVLAGPGSGKTAVITERTKYLITECRVDPKHILVITFTKAAANEMKERFCRKMGERLPVTFGTFHAIYFTVLKYAYHFESSNIISEEKRYQFMREIIQRFRLELDDENEFINQMLAEISKVKNGRIDINHFYSSHCGEDVFRKIYREYKDMLTRNRLIDFDDMLLYTYELFDQRKDILAAWQRKYEYILVDEFQDINQIQYDILKMLALPHNNLFIVGDDDQSIYRFRGSKPEIMLNFPKDYPNTVQYLLDTNYRCQENIVKASCNLIARNQKRIPKEIHANKEPMDQVRILKFKSQREENLFVIREIQAEIQKGKRYEDIAILFRTNRNPRFLMEQLMEYNLPFRTKEKVPNIYEHWIARDILTYIRIAKGSRARKDFLQIMNRPKRYISRDSLTEAEVAFDVWADMFREQEWVAERIERLEYDISMIARMKPYAAINYIRKGVGYDDFLKEYAEYRSMNLEELYDILEEFHESAREYVDYESWKAHMEAYARELEIQWAQKNQDAEAISIVTLHGSKGLEYDTVYIMDVNEGVIPYKKAVLEADVEEERRMLYVGMTRAKTKLTLTYTSNLNNKSCEPSCFLTEVHGQ